MVDSPPSAHTPRVHIVSLLLVIVGAQNWVRTHLVGT